MTASEWQYVTVNAGLVRPGFRIDLQRCPHMKEHSSAPYELGYVTHVDRETPECVVLWYEGVDAVGYAVDTPLQVAIPEWAPTLNSAVQIGSFLQQIDPAYVTPELAEIHFEGCRATLKLLPAGELVEAPQPAHAADPQKEADFAQLPLETMPPLLVRNGVVEDGIYRLRANRSRAAMLWCYVVEEIPDQH